MSNVDLYLDNDKMVSLATGIASFDKSVQDSLYGQYKEAYKLSYSSHYKGEGADSFKNYLRDGEINLITGMMDVSAELSQFIHTVTLAFLQFESNPKGKISEATTKNISETIRGKKNNFQSLANELSNVNSAISKFIHPNRLNIDDVVATHASAISSISTINNNLHNVDNDCKSNVKELLERIKDLHFLIKSTKDFAYNLDGSFNEGQIAQMTSQDWYYKQSNASLYLHLQEDPFSYSSGEVTIAEDQWAAGLCSDIYAYAGYTFCSASYEAGVEDGTAFVKASAVFFEANAYAQLTDYLRAQGSVKVGYAEGEAKAGWSTKFAGVHAEGEVGLAQAKGEVILGTDEFNAFAKGEAGVLNADGKASFNVNLEDGEFAIGAMGHANAANASGKVGLSFLKFTKKTYDKNGKVVDETKDLFGVNVGGSASIGVGAGIYLESTKAFDLGYVNVNAMSIDVDLKVLLGLKLNVTLPYIHPNYGKIWEAAKGAFNTAVDFGGKVIDGAADLGGKIIDGAVDLGGKVIDGAVDLGGKVIDGAVDLGGKVIDGAVDLGGKVIDGAVDLGGKIIDGAADLGGKIIDGAADLGSKVVDFFTWW